MKRRHRLLAAILAASDCRWPICLLAVLSVRSFARWPTGFMAKTVDTPLAKPPHAPTPSSGSQIAAVMQCGRVLCILAIDFASRFLRFFCLIFICYFILIFSWLCTKSI